MLRSRSGRPRRVSRSASVRSWQSLPTRSVCARVRSARGVRLSRRLSFFPRGGIDAFDFAACKSGYTKSGSKCVAKKVAIKAASKSNAVQLAATSSNALSSSGVKSFLGTNTGSIASWYHTNDPKDVTNGAFFSSPHHPRTRTDMTESSPLQKATAGATTPTTTLCRALPSRSSACWPTSAATPWQLARPTAASRQSSPRPTGTR